MKWHSSDFVFRGEVTSFEILAKMGEALIAATKVAVHSTIIVVEKKAIRKWTSVKTTNTSWF
jgi:hypothetical protein